MRLAPTTHVVSLVCLRARRVGLLAVHLTVSAALCLGGCEDTVGESPPTGAPASQVVNAPPSGDEAERASDADDSLAYADLVVLADRRAAPEVFAAALGARAPVTRRAAARSLARLHDPKAITFLVRALRDPDPEVRRHAALGLGAFEESAPPEAERALLTALAAEGIVDNRAAYLWDLGRIAGMGVLGAFRDALSADEAMLREGACRGLGAYGLRRRPLPGALQRRVASRARDDRDRAVRLACAYALTRIDPPEGEDRQAIRGDLINTLEDPDAEVRAMATRALAAYGPATEALVARTADSDWQVAVQAFRGLGKEVGLDRGRQGAAALRSYLDRALAADGLSPVEAQVVVTGLTALEAEAQSPGVFAVSAETADRLAALPGNAPATRAVGLAHCHAAALYDRGRGWPGTVTECGLGQVDVEERRTLEVAIIAASEGSDAQRGVYLRRLHREGNSAVRQAVLGAVPGLADPGLWALVLEDLAVREDVGVVIAACDALVSLAPVWAETVGGDAPVLSVRAPGAPAPAAPLARRRGPALPRILEALDAAGQTLVDGDDLEGLQSWLRAVRTVGDRLFLERVEHLAGHANPSLRALALDVLARQTEAAPPPVREVSNVLSAADVPTGNLGVEFETSAGAVTIELDAENAPTTVARFVALARDGYFDGLTFHRVVPAFVAQGGDPRGDGYGGPGWSQRCEDNRLRYERGTLGMALAGRDTGGSQFFITHGPQPHLDGRYTAFGRVVAGIERVDAMLVGTTIERVRILP